MASKYVVVTCEYEDGREPDKVRFKPRTWLAIERKFGDDFPQREATMFGAWFQLDPGVDFEQWVDTLEAIHDEIVDPTKEATASPEASPQ